jgi:hypothetical protein
MGEDELDQELEELAAQVMAMLEEKTRDVPHVLLTAAERDELLIAMGVSPENVDALLAMTPIPSDEGGVWVL